MNSNTHARRSRSWLHAKRAPLPLDASKVADKHRFHRYDELSGNGTGPDAEAEPLIIIPESELGSSDDGPGPVSLISESESSTVGTSADPTSTSASTSATATAVVSSPPTSESSPAVIIVSPTASPAAPSTAAVASSGLQTTHSVPGVAIGLVVAALFIALVSVIVFFVRRRAIRAREEKRQTWNKNIFTKQQEARAEQEKVFSTEPAPAYTEISPPPMSFNAILPPSQAMFAPRPTSESAVSTSPTLRSLTHPAPAPKAAPAPVTPATPAAAVPMDRSAPTSAAICCTFIPCLPDELSISTGETVRVLAEYDDGWAMCVNANGEQGMVPTECLDRGTGRIGSGDWRASRRVSSLPRSRY
ncbi:hypothetical protein HWV62_41944 [Athelia sp. TMB]|nr:hypothetical protein HWV62_41944 [Athelia sp. TMB]